MSNIEINDYIRERSSEALVMGNRTLNQIELIKEYRTRLIADVVTGKLDVRDAAEELEVDDEVKGRGLSWVPRSDLAGASQSEDLPHSPC